MSKANKQTEGQPAPDKPAQIQAELFGKRVIIDNQAGTITSRPRKSAAELCEGRTIWNSDGRSGPCLICAPPKPAAVKVTSRKVKAAWIRRADVPAGQPATGHFDCECGRQVQAGFYGDGPNVCCECGLVYDSEGWIKGPGGL